MNTKVLIETLTEIPDLQLLTELQTNLKNTGSLIVPDLNKLYKMFNSLLKCRAKPLVFKTMLLISQVGRTLLPTELQVCWRQIGGELVRAGGAEDEEIRKKGKQTIFELLNISKNSLMMLQTFYYEGLESQSNLVAATTMDNLLKIFEQHNNLLQKKSSISIIKLILQKIIQLTFKQNHHLSSHAIDFLKALFYINFSNLAQVLQRMDSSYLKAVQKIWQKDKQQLIYKQNQQQDRLKSIQYEHLPLIKDKIFGVYQPFVIKNLFGYETKAANKYAVQQLKIGFIENQELLTKYVNMITKIIVKILPDRHIEVLQLLSHILNMPGIANIINLNPLLQVLLPQLADESVPYRKHVRECLQRLNCTAKNVLQVYNTKLNEIDRNNQQFQWIKVYELLQLVEHWIQVSQPADCYPPALNDALIFAFNKRNTKITKVKEKCATFLFNLLEKYPSYRQTLQDTLSEKEMGELEDQLEQRKNFQKLNHNQNKQAKQTFIQQYNEERQRYIARKYS